MSLQYLVLQFEYKDIWGNLSQRLSGHILFMILYVTVDRSSLMRQTSIEKSIYPYGRSNTPFQLSDLVLEFFKISLACFI